MIELILLCCILTGVGLIGSCVNHYLHKIYKEVRSIEGILHRAERRNIRKS